MSKSNSKKLTVKLDLDGLVLKIIENTAKKECRSVTQQIRKILQDYSEKNRKNAAGKQEEQDMQEDVFL